MFTFVACIATSIRSSCLAGYTFGLQCLAACHTSLSFSHSSTNPQAVQNQLDRDQKVADLLTSMENVYSFVDELTVFPEKIKSLEDVIKKILQQTFECAMFIQEFAGCGFASMSCCILWSSHTDTPQNEPSSRHSQIRRLTESRISSPSSPS